MLGSPVKHQVVQEPPLPRGSQGTFGDRHPSVQGDHEPVEDQAGRDQWESGEAKVLCGEGEEDDVGGEQQR
jgi:hypothetical protein